MVPSPPPRSRVGSGSGCSSGCDRWSSCLVVERPATPAATAAFVVQRGHSGQELAGTPARVRAVDDEILLPAHGVPGADAVLNPFVIVDDAAALVTFVSEVFGVP